VEPKPDNEGGELAVRPVASPREGGGLSPQAKPLAARDPRLRGDSLLERRTGNVQLDPGMTPEDAGP